MLIWLLSNLKTIGVVVGGVGAICAACAKLLPKKYERRMTITGLVTAVLGLGVSLATTLQEQAKAVVASKQASENALTQINALKDLIDGQSKTLNELARLRGRFESIEIAIGLECPLNDSELTQYSEALFARASKVPAAELPSLREKGVLFAAVSDQGTGVSSWGVATDGPFGPGSLQFPFAVKILSNLTVRMAIYSPDALTIRSSGEKERAHLDDSKRLFLALPKGPRDYELAISSARASTFRYVETDPALWHIDGVDAIPDLPGTLLAIEVSPLDEDSMNIDTEDGKRCWATIEAVKLSDAALVINHHFVHLSNFDMKFEGTTDENLGILVYQMPRDLDVGQFYGNKSREISKPKK